MITEYKLHKNVFDEINSVEKVGANTIIPFDPANTDYQEYLEWLADGNTPEDAD